MHDPSRSDTCELCASTDPLEAFDVPPDGYVLVCGSCSAQLAAETLDPKHWFCLQQSAWSAEPAVQVVAWRLLGRLKSEAWAQDLLDQLYLDEETLAWAQQGSASADRPRTVDSNGTELADGDSVTLIKDLDVKGANFTAKRGTMVKGIRLTDDPGLVEGRVHKTAIYLKTEFLKKAG